MLLSWQLDLVLLVATWTVLHFLAPAVLKLALSQSGVPGLSRRVSECLTKLPAERQRVLRRYVRAQIYYCLAGPLGIMLITRCHSFESLLHMHTDLHDRAFALAASHWVVSLIEDWSTPHSFSIRLRKPPKNGRDPPSLYRLYLVHHLVAIVAFVVCLSTRSLPALGACGLLFELPVLFVNVRDLVRDFEPELQWFGALGGWALIDFCWSAGFLAMLVGRLGPVALYLYGLWHWSDPGGVGSVAVPCRVAYVLLGGFFSGLSVLWIAFMQRRDKEEEASLASRKQLKAVSVEEYELSRMDLEYAQKRKRPPARLLIAVDGVVYDVTKFAERHPGGLGPLHRHCGSLGSSAAFHSVGHSETAQLLMREFAVGMLPPGTGSETMEERKERIETALRDERIARTAQPYAPMSNAGWDECAPGSSEYFSLSFGGLLTALAARQVRVLPKGCKALHVYLAAAYLSMLVVLLGADGGRARSASPLTSPLVAASSLMHELQSLADGLWLLGLVSALVAAFGVLSPWHDGVVPWTTDAELRVITVGSLALVLAISRGELSNGQALLGVLGLLAHMNRLTLEAMGSLSRGLHSKCEREQHAWIGVALDLSTQVRYLVATTVFAVGNLLVQIADMLVPRPAKFYCHPTPCAYHGEGVEMGVAYFVYPGGGSRQQLAKKGREAPHSRKPTTFVCNVGHMMREHDNRDWLRLGHSTIKMSDSLKSDDAAKQGFCGQYLAEFPADHGSVRQLNLTAWVDDHSAHDWYVNNEEHKQVVDNYRNGLLASFSSMLARLHHAGNSGAKFHVRCLYCRALLTNYPEQRFCRECGWEAHYMPLF